MADAKSDKAGTWSNENKLLLLTVALASMNKPPPYNKLADIFSEEGWNAATIRASLWRLMKGAKERIANYEATHGKGTTAGMGGCEQGKEGEGGNDGEGKTKKVKKERKPRAKKVKVEKEGGELGGEEGGKKRKRAKQAKDMKVEAAVGEVEEKSKEESCHREVPEGPENAVGEDGGNNKMWEKTATA